MRNLKLGRLGLDGQDSKPFDVLTDVPGMGLFLWGKDPTTITDAGGGKVSQWRDKSGNNRHASQGTDANRPVYVAAGGDGIGGYGCVRFTGATPTFLNYVNSFLINTPFTVFVVEKCTGIASANAYLGSTFNGNYSVLDMRYLGAQQARFGIFGNDLDYNLGSNLPTQARIWQNSMGSTQWKMYENGVLRASKANTQLLTGTPLNPTIGRNAGGSAVYSGDIGAILMWPRVLTAAEQIAVTNWLSAEWGVTINDSTRTATFGDSITAGSVASTAAQRWANIVNASFAGSVLLNQGVSSSVLQNTVPNANGTATGRARYASALLGSNFSNRAFILYGVNDIFVRGTYPTLNVSAYETDLSFIVGDLIANGYTQDSIYLGSPPYFTASGDATLQAQYAAAARAVAVTHQVRYADVYNYMINNGGSSLLSGDNLHPNDAGHAAIATCMLAAGFVS